MKKKVISLFVMVVLVVSAVCPTFAIGTLSVADTVGKADYTSKQDAAMKVLENEDYIFVSTGDSSKRFFINGQVNVYEKPNEEHMDYKFITSVTYSSNNEKYNLPVRDMWLCGDVLYISWGNVKTTSLTSSGIPGASSKAAPLVKYDVSDLSEGISGTIVYSGGTTATKANPYNRGGASYLDELNEMIYQAVYSGSTRDAATMVYNVYDLSDGTPSLSKTLKGGSVDTVQFVVDGGYLFEVLHNNNGVSYSAATSQDFNNIRIYNIADVENNANISTSCLVGSYKTQIAGDRVIKDIEINGNTLYIATTKGLEVVDITDALSADAGTPAELVLSETIHADESVQGLEMIDNKLYVGLSTGMIIYNLSDGSLVEIGSYEATGGFIDFAVDSETNMLYALSGASKGNVVIINQDVLFASLEVSEDVFMQNDAEIEALEEGDLTFKMKVTNPGGKDLSFKSLVLLYEGSQLADAAVSDWEVIAGESVDITDTVTVSDAEQSHVKVMLALSDDEMTLIPMEKEEASFFEIEWGSSPEITKTSSELLEIGEMDIDGNISVSGNIADRSSKQMVVKVVNTSANELDRLSSLRYLDVVTLSENGDYAFNLIPSDAGSYEVSVLNPAGAEKVSGLVEVKDAALKVSDTVETPGREAFLCLTLENGQNVQKMNIEVTYDSEKIAVGEDLEPSEEFEISNVISEDGALKVTLTKISALTTQANEVLIIPIEIAEDADISDYYIGLSVGGEDRFTSPLYVEAKAGTLSVVESTPKYDALDDAVAALKSLTDADKIEVEDYYEEKEKIEDARAKVNAAYEYLIRDSQLGLDLIENLKASEEKLAEIKVYYDAIDSLEATEEENVAQFIADNKNYFGITDDMIELYDALEDKSKIDSKMADGEFEKPSDVLEAYTEALVLSAFAETGWQKVSTLIAYADSAKLLDLDDYNDLTENQKATANKSLARKEYESIDELQSALDNAVEDAKTTGGTKVPSSSGGGGGGGRNNSQTIYVKPAEENKTEDKPIQNAEVFNDISSYGWAKEAIENLYSAGVISGRGNGMFAPSENVTREEFAKMLALAFDIKAENAVAVFSDVSENAWYAEYVNTLASLGIIKGRGDGTFGTGDYITREDMAVMIERALTFKGVSLDESALDCADKDDVSPYAKAAVGKMCAKGIINGFGDGNIRPKYNAQRAQTAQLIYKASMLLK